MNPRTPYDPARRRRLRPAHIIGFGLFFLVGLALLPDPTNPAGSLIWQATVFVSTAVSWAANLGPRFWGFLAALGLCVVVYLVSGPILDWYYRRTTPRKSKHPVSRR